MTDFPRLIEHAFPLKQASLDSVHEKNVRHGHISTLHIWPARRPLAASRAALLATLLPDPGTPEKRRELCEKIGGRLVKKIERKKMPNGRVVEREKDATEGGVLRWLGQPKNKADREVIRQQQEDLQWFRDEIRRVYGRAPKVLDPFAGGGAIPLEAMRLGCEATAVDINPVAWFILKCTLEYPQKLAGETRPLPEFILADEAFMLAFFEKAKGYSKGEAKKAFRTLGRAVRARKGTAEQDVFDFSGKDGADIEADLAWHVRAWGQWVLARAREDLAQYYPVYADWEPLKKGVKDYERQPMRLVPLKDDGTPDIDALNDGLSPDYLTVKSNPRWVAKPTVAYLWARTVKCKNCRAEIPLLKTRWLCKKDNKRVLLTMTLRTDGSGVSFGTETDVPKRGGNTAQRREHDKQTGAGTMSRAGAKCPCCDAINTMEDIRAEGKAGRLGATPTAVVVDGQKSKEYRLPTPEEIEAASVTEKDLQEVFNDVPFGVPDEPTPAGGGTGAGRAFSVQGYGLMHWRDLFTPRQLVALGTFVNASREARDEMTARQLPSEWIEGIGAYLAVMLNRLSNQTSALSRWNQGGEKIEGTFSRFALPILWDFADTNPLADTSGAYKSALDWVALVANHASEATRTAPAPMATRQSAISRAGGEYDAIVTDPPYYDAIPYSDLMDYFYIWFRRTLLGMTEQTDSAFAESLSPKWDHEQNDGELIDDSSRHELDSSRSKAVYEDGMARVFIQCAASLKSDGRLVIVFAHKHPDAWETLVAAIIRAGFVVDGSWPIQTEMGTRMRAQSAAALASSVWLVCKKRSETAKPGWDNRVLEEMKSNIAEQLREFWDAGIRGPDFIWAATGPALEAYSKHPIVKKANDPGQVMTVSEFLSHVRKIVVDYIVGQVLSGGEGGEGDVAAAERLDEPTTYYMLHRSDFAFDDAPVGACILYATACGLSDRDVADQWDLVNKVGAKAVADDEPDADSDEEEEDSGSTDSGGKLRLKTWAQRKGKSMGYEAPSGRPIPMIDRVHRLMHLWRAGDVYKVDEYLDEHGLRRHELFRRLLQSLIELSRRDGGKEETALLESLSNHIGIRGATRSRYQREFGDDEATARTPAEAATE